MPLFAHWRKPQEISSSCKKGAQTTPLTSSTSLFCDFNSSIEQKLRRLHHLQRLSSDGTQIQREIDRYLVACVSPTLQQHVLFPHQVPSYDNLPDISSYALGILDSSMDSDAELQQVLLLLRQCTPLRRRTKRAQRELVWKQESWRAMQTLVRCMQGTLLGLYPQCLRPISFRARVDVWRFLRTILVQPFAVLQQVLHRIPYILKLCVMEHLCNTIIDYHPAICHILNRSGQHMCHFATSVSNICDIFRNEFNTLHCDAETTAAQDSILIFDVLDQLERLARSYFERCSRAYRGIIVHHVPVVHHVDMTRRHWDAGVLRRVLGDELVVHVSSSRPIFDAVYGAGNDFLWHMMRAVTVNVVPSHIYQNQAKALATKFADDTQRMRFCRKLHLCMECILRKKTPIHATRLRYDCASNQLICIHCAPGSIVAVDMLGKILTVANQHVILSCCCANFIFLRGSGHEWSTRCGEQCCHANHVFRRKERSKSLDTQQSQQQQQQQPRRRHCLVCRQSNAIHQQLQLLNPFTRSIETHGLCSHHIAPRHIVDTAVSPECILGFFQQKRMGIGASSRATDVQRAKKRRRPGSHAVTESSKKRKMKILKAPAPQPVEATPPSFE